MKKKRRKKKSANKHHCTKNTHKYLIWKTEQQLKKATSNIRTMKEYHWLFRYNRELYQKICEVISGTNPSAKYKKLTKIGFGGTAEVYKGVEIDTGRTVAIKIMNISPSEAVKRASNQFYSEVTILKMCSHQNIIQYLDSYLFGLSQSM